MALRVHRSQRADRLVEGLAALLADPLPDAFASELVVVPAKGVERWLSQRLSHRLGPGAGGDDGVCAGVEFRSPSRLVGELLERDADDPWSPSALVWPLLAVIDDSADETWCRTLALHLGVGESGEEAELRRGRRYAVAQRLARLFTSYAVQRPGLLRDWEAGRSTDGAGGELADDLTWQAELWRRLVARVGEPSPMRRQAATCARLRARADAVDLPERLSFFGHTRLPAGEVELLEALAVHRDVHVWMCHPSDVLWRDLRELSGVVERAVDRSHLRAGHPLLAGLGRDVREIERLLAGADDAGDLPVVHGEHLLGRLQADLAANTLPASPRPLSPGDTSISVHACHGPSRQVEVLREVLVGLLADDPTLEPRDVLVMCPDIEAYAPLVTAAFGMGDLLHGRGHPGQELRVQLADRALTQTNPLLAVALALVELASGRAEASRVLDLLALDPVRRRFGLSEEHLERVAQWVDHAGIRWAFDAQHRSTFGLDGFVQNTWSFGLDRILAGVAVSEDTRRWFDRTLPLDDVSSTDIDLAGRLAELLDRLRTTADRLVGSHPVGHWLATLREGIEAITLVGAGEEWQLGQVQRELGAIGDRAADETDLRLSDVRSLLEERFAGRPTRANFRTGALTVCTMTPMRSVPHRVVCLLGLDDGVFPRAGAADGDDVLARRPLTGERDPRSEDRQLMLDAVLAARDHLVITYTGAHESTGQRRPPAVPLKELLDAVDLTALGGAEAVTTHHPLQAFDARNLQPGAPFSFDPAALRGARAAAGARTAPEAIADLVLPPLEGDLELDDLLTFVRAPVLSFLRRRLDVALPADDDRVSDAIPVGLDGLASWSVGDRMLRDVLAGVSPDDAVQLAWRRGSVPPGRLGWRLLTRLRDKVVPIADLAESVTGGVPASAVDVEVTLSDGRRLTGTIGGVHGQRVVSSGFSRLGARQELEAWVRLVVLENALPGRGWSAGAIGRGDREQPAARVAFGQVDDAPARLVELVALYDAGMRGPLPLPLKTAHAYARRRRRTDPTSALHEARKEWSPGSWSGEANQAAHLLVWGEAPLEALLGARPLPGEEHDDESTRFGALARRLWTPLLEARVAS